MVRGSILVLRDPRATTPPSASRRCPLPGERLSKFQRLPEPFSLLNISPDGAELLVKDNQGTDYRGQLWRLPILGGSPRRLGALVGQDAAWSPDGKLLVYADGSHLFLAKSDGTEPRKLVSVTGRGFYPAWAPDGTRLRFTVIDDKTGAHSLWEVSAQGSNLHPLFPGWHNPPDECCGKWTEDGKYFVFQSQGQIWARSEQRWFFRHSTGNPVLLTSSPLGSFTPVPSKDGKKLFVVGRTYRGELQRRESKSGQFTPFLSGISAEDVAFSKDGKWVAYVSYPGKRPLAKQAGRQREGTAQFPSAVGGGAALGRPTANRLSFFDYSVGKRRRSLPGFRRRGQPAATAARRSRAADGSELVARRRPGFSSVA